MKKSLLALAALTAFAGAASAQSSVTLFGIIDVNVRGVDNGNGGRTSVSTDGNSSSRLGFRGIEDLGGGLRAGFWIEGAFAADTGSALSTTTSCQPPVGTAPPVCTTTAAGGQTWQRRATVSLLGGFGEVRLGRDYTPTFWNHTVFDPFGTNGVGNQLNLMTQQGFANPNNMAAGTLVRANNTVGYFLPAMGGLYGQLMWTPSEGTVGNEYIGGRIGYAAGPFNVAFAYGETKHALGASSDDKLEAYNMGASWNLGFMTLMGQYHNYSVASRETENYLIGMTMPMGPGTLKASYAMTSLDSGLASLPSGDAQQLAVGYVYDLSKRTAIYAHYSIIDNDSGLRYTVVGSSNDGKTNGAGGFQSQGMELGIRHSF